MLFIGPLCTVLSIWLVALTLQQLHVFGWLDHIPLVPHFGVAVTSASH
jgi:hypothetical protein